MKTTTLIIALFGLLAPMAAAAQSDDTYNGRYGETRINSLPKGGAVTKKVWVGSWWDYTRDGIAYRYQTKKTVDGWKKQTDRFADHADPASAPTLSPAEKLDTAMGRAAKIETEPMGQYLAKVLELGADMDKKIEEKQTLVRKLNSAIAENSEKTGWTWKDTDEGKRYVALETEIKEASSALEAIKKDSGWKIDTATEFEVMHHGNGQFGIGDWWGHCNAWAAAAIMEPEPIRDVTVGDVTFTAADIKALLTETWMENQATFFGSRNEWDSDEESRARPDFQDVTPAAFHIQLTEQLGARDKSFVIDRYTGSQVWNQPLKAYRSWYTPMYEVDAEGKAVVKKAPLRLTRYNGQGAASHAEIGEREMYPVQVKTTFWWVTDGLPHDAVTVDGPELSTITDEQFQDWWWVKKTFDDQIHLRTLTYELWLTAPLDDPEARIVGDGKWEHGDASEYNHTHPDFLWQPLENVNNSYRDYENEFVDHAWVTREVLPGAIAAHEDPETPPDTFAAEGLPLAIEDAAPEKPAVSVLTIEDARVVHTLAVHVAITHSYIGDLQIELEAPSAAAEATITLGCTERQTPTCDGCSCEACVCEADAFCCGTAWDNLCAKSCVESCGGCSGAKKVVLKKKGDGGSAKNLDATYDVREFEGLGLLGEWKLRVSDHAKQDTGSIESWSLQVK